MQSGLRNIKAVDSHTAGEPTRVVIDGGPDLGSGTLAERLRVFKEHHDAYRSAIVNEPRGSDVLVGALLTEPSEPGCAAGVIFFNNVGYLGMCGHGTIGLIATLAYLGRIGTGAHRIDTPVGVVTARLHEDGRVSVRNVPAFRLAKGVRVSVAGIGEVVGDVAWGGNWFFLVEEHGKDLQLGNVESLTVFASAVKRALWEHGITGEGGAGIDHVELFGPAVSSGCNSRSFVLCPGNAYDRSPCGTGTSAKLACLYADGKLKAGEVWRQESVIGTVFEGSIEIVDDQVIPTITGRAYITGYSTLVLGPDDPLCWGIR